MPFREPVPDPLDERLIAVERELRKQGGPGWRFVVPTAIGGAIGVLLASAVLRFIIFGTSVPPVAPEPSPFAAPAAECVRTCDTINLPYLTHRHSCRDRGNDGWLCNARPSSCTCGSAFEVVTIYGDGTVSHTPF